jgi:hypothetical protein
MAVSKVLRDYAEKQAYQRKESFTAEDIEKA